MPFEFTSYSVAASEDLRTPLASLSPLPRPATILLVDTEDINRRLLRGILRTGSYRMVECVNATEAMRIIESEAIDLIVVDLMLPGISGPDFCRWLKASRKTQLIPVLMLTSIQGIENEIEGLTSGADEFLLKPLHPAVVRARVRAMLRNKAVTDSLEEAETILFALAHAVESRDKFTGQHCERLANMSVKLGTALGLPKEDLVALYRGGFLHDIGKICIPDAILFKHGSLSVEEWSVMRQHPVRGEEICKPMNSLAPVLPIIRNHHERWDGSGYPDGLASDEIPLLARILQVVDIYDALVTERPYKPAMSREAAFSAMEQEVRSGWRDPDLVPLFINTVQHEMGDSLERMRNVIERQNGVLG
jgi:putative two-component system response regulator